MIQERTAKRSIKEDLKKVTLNLVQRAERFVPRNWKLFSHHFIESKDELNKKIEEIYTSKKIKNALYIEISIFEPISFLEADLNEYRDYFGWAGKVNGPMKWRDGNVAIVEVFLRDILDLNSHKDFLMESLVHELAHIAVMRWEGLQLKRKRGQILHLVGGESCEHDAHGPVFQKAYKAMIKRTERFLDEKVLKFNKLELAMLEEEVKQERFLM